MNKKLLILCTLTLFVMAFLLLCTASLSAKRESKGVRLLSEFENTSAVFMEAANVDVNGDADIYGNVDINRDVDINEDVCICSEQDFYDLVPIVPLSFSRPEEQFGGFEPSSEISGAGIAYNQLEVGDVSWVDPPANIPYNTKITYTSNHPEIASVTKRTGFVTAKSPGKVTITLTYKYRKRTYRAKCYIQVTQAEDIWEEPVVTPEPSDATEPTQTETPVPTMTETPSPTPVVSTSPVPSFTPAPEATQKPSDNKMTEETILQKLKDLQQMYPDGAFWNHVGTSLNTNSTNNFDMVTSSECPTHSNYKLTCNRWLWNKSTAAGVTPSKTVYTWGYQCAGYAFMISDRIFGINNNTITAYYTDIDSLRIGDCIRYNNDSHSAIVTGVYSDYITTTDCNGTGVRCQISWDKKVTKNKLESTNFYGISRY